MLGITAHRNLRMRGQAFVTLENRKKCEDCVKHFQKDVKGNPVKILGKVPELQLAKTESDVAVEKKLKKEEYEKYLEQRKAKKKQREDEKIMTTTANDTKAEAGADDGEKTGQKRSATAEDQDDSAVKAEHQAKKPKVDLSTLPPNKVLLVQNLPADITDAELIDIFSKFSGFVEVRLVKIRKVAFIEYEAEEGATAAKEANKALNIRGTLVIVNYAKK